MRKLKLITFLIFAVLSWQRLVSAQPDFKKAKAEENLNPAQQAEIANKPLPEKFAYDSHGKRNPFIPLVTSAGVLLRLEDSEEKKPGGDLALEGIIYDEKGISYAIVNGNVVKVGDSVGDYQVLKVQKNKVVFIKNNQNFEIELKKEDE